MRYAKVDVDVVASREVCDEAVRNGQKRLLLDYGNINRKSFYEWTSTECQ